MRARATTRTAAMTDLRLGERLGLRRRHVDLLASRELAEGSSQHLDPRK
jgi:hypothetical protein